MTVKDLPAYPQSRIKIYGFVDETKQPLVILYDHKEKHYAYCVVAGQDKTVPIYLTFNTKLKQVTGGYELNENKQPITAIV